MTEMERLKEILVKRDIQIIRLMKENAAFQRHFEAGEKRIEELEKQVKELL